MDCTDSRYSEVILRFPKNVRPIFWRIRPKSGTARGQRRLKSARAGFLQRCGAIPATPPASTPDGIGQHKAIRPGRAMPSPAPSNLPDSPSESRSRKMGFPSLQPSSGPSGPMFRRCISAICGCVFTTGKMMKMRTYSHFLPNYSGFLGIYSGRGLWLRGGYDVRQAIRSEGRLVSPLPPPDKVGGSHPPEKIVEGG